MNSPVLEISVSELLKKKAFDLGFCAVGVASTEPIRENYLEEWLEKNYHGEMSWMAASKEKRLNPQLLLPGAKSLILAALPYEGKGKMALSEDPSVARIARYALAYRDYHDVLRERLQNLAGHLQDIFPGAQAKVYVDSGPLLEKHLAARASLGWIGKHTNLLNPEGSWFFLGVILTDAELDFDSPARDRCGTCARCIRSCPTGAIVAPYVLDARRCISYLTIELKGFIPRELRPLIGNRVFGCDDCQEVCPWNRFARSGDPELLPEEENMTARLEDFLTLSAEDFRKRFQESPILRAKRRGFLRNVCVALGNAKEERSIPALSRALRDEEPLVRGHAAWALAEIGGPKAREALEETLLHESHPEVVREIKEAMSHA